MKCCVSPTTATVVNPTEARPVQERALQAMMFSEIFKPLAKDLGPVGDIAVESVAQHLFVQPRS